MPLVFKKDAIITILINNNFKPARQSKVTPSMDFQGMITMKQYNLIGL